MVLVYIRPKHSYRSCGIIGGRGDPSSPRVLAKARCVRCTRNLSHPVSPWNIYRYAPVKILVSENVTLNWVGDPIPRGGRQDVEEAELSIEEVQEFSGGSRRDGAAAGANMADAEYLGLLGFCLN